MSADFTDPKGSVATNGSAAPARPDLGTISRFSPEDLAERCRSGEVLP
jgi:hypothetical protein